MARPWKCAFLLLVYLVVLTAALSATLRAQSTKAINLRILDSRTGRPVLATGFQVRINHQPEMHGDWVKQDEDGSAVMTLPADAADVSIRALYDDSMEFFVNCDADPRKGPVGKLWYKVPEILASGVVAPNICTKAAVLRKLNITAAPGDFVLFVRPRTWRDGD